MLPKAHLTLHSRMFGSRWVMIPLWLSGSWRSFLYSSVYSCHLFLISSASVRSIPFLSFIEPIFAWTVPLVSLLFLKRSLVFPILLFSSLSLHWSLRKAFLSLLSVLWKSAFKWVYLFFSSLPFTSFLTSVQLSCLVVFSSLRPHEPQHARPPCPWPTPGAHLKSWPLSRLCHPNISFSVIPFFSCPQSFLASLSFPMSQLFTSGGQSIGVSVSTLVLPMNIQDWSLLGWTGWTSLQSKGLSRVFSNTTVQKHQSFCIQLSLQSNSHIHTWPLEKP